MACLEGPGRDVKQCVCREPQDQEHMPLFLLVVECAVVSRDRLD